MADRITVLGAGSVGVSTALHLQQRGWQVTLIDRYEPGSQTSYGNAGIIHPGSSVPFNNPDLHKGLLRLLANNKAELRYNLLHTIKQFSWVLQFLQASKTRAATRTCEALHSLAEPSLVEHKAFMQRAGNMHRLTERGWLKVYRSGSGFDKNSFLAKQLTRFNVPVDSLGAADIQALEPALKPIFTHGYLLSGAAQIDNPGELIREYAARFVADGGRLLSESVIALSAEGDSVICHTPDQRLHYERLVIAAGPWSADLMTDLGYHVPLGFERGYHAQFKKTGEIALTRSVHDISSGYLIAPMEPGLRITTGVELNHRDAPANYAQFEQVLPAVREAIDLGERTDDPVWCGSRPTLPDSKPIIDKAPGHSNVWLAFGHQHIGLMTGPITGKLLAQQISGEKTDTDLTPFSARRCVTRIRRRKPKRKKTVPC